MRAPLHVLLLLSAVGAVPAVVQADGARRTTVRASSELELNRAARPDSLRTADFNMSRTLLEPKGFLLAISVDLAVGTGGSSPSAWFQVGSV